MKVWARISDGIVAELPELEDDLVPGRDIFSPEMTFVDATSVEGIAIGWSYANGSFSAPPPRSVAVATIAQLLTLASNKQNAVLGQVWTFNVGTTDAPINLTTMLDLAGQLAMQKIASWAKDNASSAGATLPYSNVDLSGVSITVDQANALCAAASSVDLQTFSALNDLSAGIRASPPTITTMAQINSAPWPSPSS